MDTSVQILDEGVLMPSLINAHTHCADAGAHPSPGITLEELVAPPDGLKHRYLREAPRDVIVDGIRDYARTSRRNGISRFIDFREGGAEGCRMLREAATDGFVMGRPISPSFDPAEMEEILSVADGIALPSVTDMDGRYVEQCAEAAHKKGKPFAIHVSERIREDVEFVLSLEPAFVVHMVQATDSDLRLCADAGVPVVVCPRSNRFFGLTPPLSRMVRSGVTLALGTDNAMLCSPDLRPEALLASSILKSQNCQNVDALNLLASGSAAVCRRLGLRPEPVVLPFARPDDPSSVLESDLPVVWKSL